MAPEPEDNPRWWEWIAYGPIAVVLLLLFGVAVIAAAVAFLALMYWFWSSIG